MKNTYISLVAKNVNISTRKWSNTNKKARDMRRTQETRRKLRDNAKGHYTAMMVFITEYNSLLNDSINIK